MSEAVKQNTVIENYRTSDKDTGSPEVQIVTLDCTREPPYGSLAYTPQGLPSRRGLIKMTSRRRKLLDYLKRKDLNKYKEIIKSLNLRR